jgi:hypothetical protein
MAKGNATKRARNFACVVYPESAPEDWQQILSDQFIPAFISPLHDRDVNPGGESKKHHYHILLMYEGVKTNEQVRQVFDLIGGVGLEVVQSLRGYARYLCHLDNPEKVQYDTDDVKCLCGADYYGIIGLPTDRYKVISDIMDFCKEQHIDVYADLVDYCRESRYDWFRVLCDNGTYVISRYLKSISWRKKVEKLREAAKKLEDIDKK